MSFFERAFASIGIGSAKVDTHIQNRSLKVGGNLEGYIHITGGKLEQQVDKVYLDLMTSYIRERDDRKVTEEISIMKVDLFDSFILNPGENKQIPFSFIVPNETPVSLKKDSVWLRTGLDIKMAIDPSDKDYLNILPHDYMQVILNALNDLGFVLVQCENEYTTRFGLELPFVQEFEFRPTTHFRGALDELEVAFQVANEGVEILIEIDRKARGLSGLIMESLNLDESLIHRKLPAYMLNQGSTVVAEFLAETINQYI